MKPTHNPPRLRQTLRLQPQMPGSLIFLVLNLTSLLPSSCSLFFAIFAGIGL